MMAGRCGLARRWVGPRDDLRDVQLGLAISALLPPELAEDWQAILARWRAIHAAERVYQTMRNSM